MNIFKKRISAKDLGREVAFYVVDTTSGLTATSPIFTLVEKTFNTMTNEVSWNTRRNVIITSYIFTGYAYARIRDYIIKRRNIPVEQYSSFDGRYAMAFNGIVTPFLYLVSGETDMWNLAKGTGMSMLLGKFITGKVLGHAIETGRDFLGIKDSPRLPDVLRSLPRPVKVGMYMTAPFLSYALMQGIYAMTPSWEKEQSPVKPASSNARIIEEQKSAADSLKGFVKADSLDALTNYYSTTEAN